VAEDVDTSAEYVTAWCDGGYMTNLAIEDVAEGKAWVVCEYEGEPLDAEHGGPAQLLVPICTSGRTRRGPRPRVHGRRGRTAVPSTERRLDGRKDESMRMATRAMPFSS
jgi:hypothetical protein